MTNSVITIQLTEEQKKFVEYLCQKHIKETGEYKSFSGVIRDWIDCEINSIERGLSIRG